MADTVDRGAWRRACARQALTDLQCEAALARDPQLPVCHELHFLQMACEKLCKAQLCADGADPVKLRTSHAYIAKVLWVVVRDRGTWDRVSRRGLKRWSSLVKQLAREIELLAPSVDAVGARPDNCGYPWLDDLGRVQAPAHWHFAGVEGLCSNVPFRVMLDEAVYLSAMELTR